MNIDGGIHEIPLPAVEGRLWLCGKHVIGPDPVGVLDRVGADHVVCLVERHELAERYSDYVRWLESSGRATWFPVADLHFVSMDDIVEMIESVVSALRDGTSIIAHCAAGIGRAGTLAVAVCMSLDMSADAALDHVRRHRPGAGPEAGSQLEFVRQWARSNERRSH